MWKYKTLDNIQLETLLNNKYTKEYFRGVFPAEKLPKSAEPPFPCAYIANLDPSNKPGSHWVAFFFNGENGKNNKPNEYFCSFGFPPWYEHFESFLKEPYKYNKHQFQNMFSLVCGYYGVFFICCKLAGKNPNIELNAVTNKDLYVIKYIEKTFWNS